MDKLLKSADYWFEQINKKGYLKSMSPEGKDHFYKTFKEQVLEASTRVKQDPQDSDSAMLVIGNSSMRDNNRQDLVLIFVVKENDEIDLKRSTLVIENLTNKTSLELRSKGELPDLDLFNKMYQSLSTSGQQQSPERDIEQRNYNGQHRKTPPGEDLHLGFRFN